VIHPPLRSALAAIATAVALSAGAGCDLLPGQSLQSLNRQVLPPIPAPLEAVDVEVYVVERVVGDPLLGDALWRELNQAVGPPAVRLSLLEQGLQYGLAPSHPSFALESLLNDKHPASDARRTVRHALIVPADSSPEIEIAWLPGIVRIPRPGAPQGPRLEVQNCRAVLRMTAERLQDGWVRLAFLPDVHHGADRVRPVATERDWTTRSGQDIEPYYDCRFAVEMNTGEHVVIGLADRKGDSLGRLFFQEAGDSARLQRLLVVRLVGQRQIEAVRSDRAANDPRMQLR
jgi:hypothetical protein